MVRETFISDELKCLLIWDAYVHKLFKMYGRIGHDTNKDSPLTYSDIVLLENKLINKLFIEQ